MNILNIFKKTQYIDIETRKDATRTINLINNYTKHLK